MRSKKAYKLYTVNLKHYNLLKAFTKFSLAASFPFLLYEREAVSGYLN
jgi:hypothetical protein